jgi:hypothetical protein
MVSQIKSRLFLACISAATISLALIAPYEVVNSPVWKYNNPTEPNPISKIDLDEDEFTGDSVPILDNADIIYNRPIANCLHQYRSLKLNQILLTPYY